MSWTQDLSAKLILDLQSISGIGDVRKEPTLRSALKKPAATLVPFGAGKGGDSDIARSGIKSREAEQNFAVEFVLSGGSDPHSQAELLLDNARNAVERPAGNLLSLNNVISVEVTDWTEVLTSGALSNQIAIFVMAVAVRYHYTRGAL